MMRRVGTWLYVLVVVGLALPALALTLPRLVPSDNGRVVRAVSFTTLGLPVSALLLLVLLAGVVRPSPTRRVRAAVAVVAASALGLHVWWFAPQVTGDNPAPAAGAARVTVMSANLFEGRADAQELVDTVRSEGVDLLVLEEITPQLLEQMDALGLAELLPERVGQPDYMVAGTMILANKPLTDHVRVRTTFQSWQATYDGHTVLGVHPVAPVDPAGWRADHAAILTQAEAAHADLILGDMNATPDHDVMRHLDDAGFRDAAGLSNEGWQPTWPANHVGIVPWLGPVIRIDHVLLGDSTASLGTHTVDIQGTDHLALVATLARR
jgi:endonuclease/exonuclease/phosphatase family metal-dependent hydrolase